MHVYITNQPFSLIFLGHIIVEAPLHGCTHLTCGPNSKLAIYKWASLNDIFCAALNAY